MFGDLGFWSAPKTKCSCGNEITFPNGWYPAYFICSNCGKEVNENAVICTQCGCFVNGNTSIVKAPSSKRSNKIVDLIMIIGYAVFGFLTLLLTIIGSNSTTLVILLFVFSVLFAGSMAVAFALSFKVEKAYSRTLATLLFIESIITLFTSMFAMIAVL